jgi:predicted ester cyclase
VLHDPSQPEPVQGVAGGREFIASVEAAFPDAHYSLDDLAAERDRVVQPQTVSGTHRADFAGVPAMGRSVSVWLLVISRVAGGKVAEEWQLVDTLGMLQQIGASPGAGD